MTDARVKVQKVILDWVPCIYYLVQFKKVKKATIQAFINLDSKIYAISLVYAKQLSF